MIVFFVFLIVVFASVVFRYSLFHAPSVFYNFCHDLFSYVRFRKYNEFKDFGRMDVFVAAPGTPFGSGKTLSLVHTVKQIYHRYNNKPVWSEKEQRFIKQRIKIFSNITLRHIPFIPLVSEQQIVNISDQHEDGVISLIIIDEIGSQFNNRNWKNNLSFDLLEAILQQRKSKISIIATVQDFSLYDMTLRKLTSRLFVCRMCWRFVLIKAYYAVDFDRSQGNLDLVKPLSSFCFFSTDFLFHFYDTSERVSRLCRDVRAGNMLTNQEILVSSSGSVDINSLTRVKRKFRKRFKK